LLPAFRNSTIATPGQGILRSHRYEVQHKGIGVEVLFEYAFTEADLSEQLQDILTSDSFMLNLIAMAPKYGLPSVAMVEFLKAGNKKDAKHARIADIEMAMKGRRVFIYAGMPHYDRLNSQLLKFPNVKHDDYADAFALGFAGTYGLAVRNYPSAARVDEQKMDGKISRESAEVQADWPDSGGGTGLACGG